MIGVKEMTDAKKTLSEVTYDAWVAGVMASDERLASDVKKYGVVPESVLTREAYSQLGFLQYSSAIAKGQADLRRIIHEKKQIEGSTQISGILAGARDAYGTKQPVRFAILSPDGRHVEVSSFDTQFTKEGRKVSVPIPSKVTVNATYDETYGSFNLVSLVDYTRMSDSEFNDYLVGIAKPVSQIYPEDRGKVAVIRGTVRYVNPAPRWKDRAIDGEEVVWQYNQKRNPDGHPVIRIKFDEETIGVGGMCVPISVSATLSRMKNVTPVVKVPDLVGICQYAVTQSEEPREQARIVGDVIRDRDIIVVGRVSGYEPRQDRTYVNIDVYTMVQVVKPELAATLSVPEPIATTPSNTTLVGEPGGTWVVAGSTAPQVDAGKEQPSQPQSKGQTIADEIMKYLDVVTYITGVFPKDIDGRAIWEERYKDRVSYEIFDVVLQNFIKTKSGR